MRVKDIMPFKDKYKKVVYQKGQEIDVTNERIDEFSSAAPFVKAISKPEEPKKPAPQKPTTKKTTTKKSTKKK